MTALLLRVVAVVVALGAAYTAGRVHQGWKEGAARERAVSARLEAIRKQTLAEAKAELDEQKQRETDTGAVDAAQSVAAGVDWASCPAVPADFVRLLNAIGTAGPAAGAPAGEMPRAAETAGD